MTPHPRVSLNKVLDGVGLPVLSKIREEWLGIGGMAMDDQILGFGGAMKVCSSLFRWGVALQQRSHLRPGSSKEKVELPQQAKRLYEDALHMDSNNMQVKDALSSCVSIIGNVSQFMERVTWNNEFAFNSRISTLIQHQQQLWWTNKDTE